MTHRPLLSSLALALAACGLGFVERAEAAPMYLCKAIDGSVHLANDNMASRFRAAMVSCTLAEPDAQPAESVSADSRPDDVVMISRRSSRRGPKGTGGARHRGGLRELPSELIAIVEDAAQRHRIDPRVVQAVMLVESGYNQRARSPKGALGLMQLMPATAARFYSGPTSDLFDPAVNIDVGVRYLSVLADLFDDRLELVLAAYNAGEGAVMRRGWRVPPFPETEAYVEKIIGLLSEKQ